MNDKEILFYDTETYENKQSCETQITESVFRLKQIYDSAMGKKADIDYSKLVKEPINYIVNSYWNEYCSQMPEHLNRVSIFTSQTGITEGDIQAEFEAYTVCCAKMQSVHGVDALPKATKSDITFKEDLLPKFLNESKRKQFELLKRFVKVANLVQKQGISTGPINVVRFAPDLLIEDGKVAVNLHRFIL